MDKIFTEIREGARKEAEQLVARARRVAEREQQHARADADARAAARREACTHEANVREERAVSRRTSEARRAALAQRDQFIAGVFARALDTLRTMPRDKRYETWIRRMATMALRQFPHGGATVMCTSSDADVVARALTGLPITVATDRADIAGGIIVKSQDGRVSVDCSVESALARAQDDLRDAVLKKLIVEV
jgi:vacuolar-type H+-ATPase subunit E/Vma4